MSTPTKTDSRTGLPLRQYVAAYGPSGSQITNVRVIGPATDLVNREVVSAEVEETTGYVPEYVAQVAPSAFADAELLVTEYPIHIRQAQR